jgi:hypothetical protein
MLSAANLIKREARGTKAYYSILDPQIFDLCALVCGQLAMQMSSEAAANETFISAMQSQAT